MSFSSEVKEEILNKISKNKNECCAIAEAFGESLTSASLKNDIKGEYEKLFNISDLNECCIKSILKGVFLSSGCIVDPNLDYHFEVNFKNKACAEYFLNLLSVLDFMPKIIKRKKIYNVYIKDSDQISLFLSLVEASKAMLNFEQVRVEKEVKNNINRSINCETANLAKTIKSSMAQIEAIDKLKQNGIFDTLNDKLKYTANLRIKYPNESLDFISKKTSEDNYVSKSGLKHRLDKIIEIANKI